MAGCLYVAVFTTALAMVFYGFVAGVLNSPQAVILKFITESFAERYGTVLTQGQAITYFGVANTMMLVGGIVSTPIAGIIANRYGRRNGLLIVQIPALIGTILMGLVKTSSSFEMLIIGRFVVGFASGLFATIGPIYTSEISPIRLRGSTGTTNCAAYSLGLLLAALFGLSSVLGTEDRWPYLVSLTAIPSIVLTLVLPFMPESPLYLILQKNDKQRGIEAIKKLHGEDKVSEMLAEICPPAVDGDEDAEPAIGVFTLLRSSRYRLAMTVSVCLHLSMTVSGFIGLLFFSTTFFQQSGIDCAVSQYATAIIAVILGITSYLGGRLMDRFGRRKMLLICMAAGIVFTMLITIGLNVMDNDKKVDCSSGSSTSNEVNGVGVYLLICTFAFAIVFAAGPGSIPWVMTFELFDQTSRGAAGALSLFVQWFSAFITGLIFPIFLVNIPKFSFLPFGLVSALLFVFLVVYLPETRNRSPKTVSQLFEINNAWSKPIGLRSEHYIQQYVEPPPLSSPSVAMQNLSYQSDSNT